MATLDKHDLTIILEALIYTRLNYEGYTKYPSEEFKKKQIMEIYEITNKIKELLKEKEETND